MFKLKYQDTLDLGGWIHVICIGYLVCVAPTVLSGAITIA